ncbi:MAG: CCA tRNA nucleotidyltransferase, partial [Pseudomonadota bacterium]
MAIKPRLANDWLNEQPLGAVFAALGDAECRLVGGCVRDGLIGLPVADIDLATTLVPNEIMSKAEAAGLKAIPTGLSHGTVTVIASSVHFEVTTLREDVATDGRHAVVAFASDWRTDAARRDFTINALYADARGDVTDYFGGLDDLEAKRVRFIGAPAQRITEDALRILRFYRFSGRFAGTLDEEGRAACAAKVGMIKSLSRERIAAEWLKILAHDTPAETIAAMVQDGVVAAFLPEATLSGLQDCLAREEESGLSPSVARRFAAMLPRDETVVNNIARRLKLSNVLRKALVGRVLAAQATSQSPHALYYRFGFEEGQDGLLLSGLELPADAAPWTRPTFPIKAADIQAAAGLEGKALGAALH